MWRFVHAKGGQIGRARRNWRGEFYIIGLMSAPALCAALLTPVTAGGRDQRLAGDERIELEFVGQSVFHTTVGVGERAAAEGKELTGLLRWRVSEWVSFIMLECDLMAWEIGRPCTFPHSDATRDERNFEEERQRTLRQREWTAKHPLPVRGCGVAREWDYLSRACIEQQGG